MTLIIGKWPSINKIYIYGKRRYVWGNLPFADWGTIFDSTTVATAIADRLVYNSEILILEGSSYRKRSRKINPS